MKPYFLLVTLIASLAACGSGEGQDKDNTRRPDGGSSTPRPDGGSTPRPDAEPEEDVYSLHVENNTDLTIFELFISGQDAPSWGPDLLGADVLEPGESIVVEGLVCDDYDVKVTDELEDECESDDVVLVCEDDALFYISADTFSGCF